MFPISILKKTLLFIQASHSSTVIPSPPMDSSPTVVILGSTGTIGASLCTFLERLGIRAVGVSRSQCDLLDAEATLRFAETLPPHCTIVFTAVINRWKEDSFPAMVKNLTMVEHVAEAVRGRIRSMVYLSSVDVYGRRPQLPIQETTSPHPESYYAIAKYSGERLLQLALENHCPLSILRLPGVYGKDAEERSILGSFLKKVLYQEPITIFGDGSILRDFLFVDDVCELIRRLVLDPRPGTFNVATGTSLPLLEILRILGEVLETAPIIRFAPSNTDSASDLSFDTTGLGIAYPDWVATPLHEGASRLASRIRG
jgi:UDP-glucose 4-epimerase